MPKRWIVVDNAFNQANYSSLIGNKYDQPPGYAAVTETVDYETARNELVRSACEAEEVFGVDELEEYARETDF